MEASYALGAGDTLDADGNGIEDALDRWHRGDLDWAALRRCSGGDNAEDADAVALPMAAKGLGPPVWAREGPWARGHLRVVALGATATAAGAAAAAASRAGTCRVLRALDLCGGLAVFEVDPAGLHALLTAPLACDLVLDRDGRPALAESRKQMGAMAARAGPWQLRGDWTTSVAILDSGCDTAHDDLGDFSSDNVDGPPPAVGHALDWFSAEEGWPVFLGYKVIGWHDVTDDFPQAQGPWDYHYHGTALAGVVAGSGEIDPDLYGVAADGRLTIVKTYDFDGIWHQWASDFVAGCAWVLEHHETYRIRTVLCAVNWDADVGISTAVADLVTAGVLTVAAAGNDGGDVPLGYPARLPDVLTVGAINDAGDVAAYSGRGVGEVRGPDLVAPGGGLLAETGRITTTDNEPNDTYSDRFGTSLAAAHAAGAVFLLTEALRTEGVPVATDRAGPELIVGALRATAAPIAAIESADGQGRQQLPPHAVPDAIRGWGGLQAQAAVQGILRPLPADHAATDTLRTATPRQEVVAWRLTAPPGERYRITAQPQAGLDLRLDVHDLGWHAVDPAGMPPLVSDRAGAGGEESLVYAVRQGSVVVVAVKRVAGSGAFMVSAERDVATIPADVELQLVGKATGWGCAGDLSGSGEPVLVLPSLVGFDSSARAIHAFRTDGSNPAGWPVFVFVSPSLEGGLGGPLVWDLDGEPGDEVVIASEFGNIYFLNRQGLLRTVSIEANLDLLAPVGVTGPLGQRSVAVFDADGVLHRFDAGGNDLGSVDFDSDDPRPPAVGQLDGGTAEEIVVVFASGHAYALSYAGVVLPGWPCYVGPGSPQAPVLFDGDGDGRHEIAIPVLDPDSAGLRLRLFTGDGEAAPGDNTTVPAPGGGGWRRLALPAVIGNHVAAARQVLIAGITDNLAAGEARRWRIASAAVTLSGGVASDRWPGFEIRAATESGVQDWLWVNMLAPIVWNSGGDSAGEPELLLSLGWAEFLSGGQDLYGGMTGWLDRDGGFAARRPLEPGGVAARERTTVWGAVYPLAEEWWLRVSCSDRNLRWEAVSRVGPSVDLWSFARGDARNTAAKPLRPPVTATPAARVNQALFLAPNPSRGRLDVAWSGLAPGPAVLEIFDLRGRRIRRLVAADAGAISSLAWDGRDDRGRPVAAGSYMLRLRHAAGTLTGRATIAR